MSGGLNRSWRGDQFNSTSVSISRLTLNMIPHHRGWNGQEETTVVEIPFICSLFTLLHLDVVLDVVESEH